MDLPGADENLLALQKRFAAVELAPISAATGEGLDAFKTKLEQWLTSASEKDRHRHLVSRKTKQTVPAD